MALRAHIVLAAAQGDANAQIARDLEVNVDTVRLWRDRWVGVQGIDLETLGVAECLQDAPRPGAPARITVEQRCQIAALACEAPSKAGRPIRKSDRVRNRRGSDGAGRRPRIVRRDMRHIYSKKGSANCSDRTASALG